MAQRWAEEAEAAAEAEALRAAAAEALRVEAEALRAERQRVVQEATAAYVQDARAYARETAAYARETAGGAGKGKNTGKKGAGGGGAGGKAQKGGQQGSQERPVKTSRFVLLMNWRLHVGRPRISCPTSRGPHRKGKSCGTTTLQRSKIRTLESPSRYPWQLCTLASRLMEPDSSYSRL